MLECKAVLCSANVHPSATAPLATTAACPYLAVQSLQQDQLRLQDAGGGGAGALVTPMQPPRRQPFAVGVEEAQGVGSSGQLLALMPPPPPRSQLREGAGREPEQAGASAPEGSAREGPREPGSAALVSPEAWEAAAMAAAAMVVPQASEGGQEGGQPGARASTEAAGAQALVPAAPAAAAGGSTGGAPPIDVGDAMRRQLASHLGEMRRLQVCG